jgi:hypothetical protein
MRNHPNKGTKSDLHRITSYIDPSIWHDFNLGDAAYFGKLA